MRAKILTREVEILNMKTYYRRGISILHSEKNRSEKHNYISFKCIIYFLLLYGLIVQERGSIAISITKGTISHILLQIFGGH